MVKQVRVCFLYICVFKWKVIMVYLQLMRLFYPKGEYKFSWEYKQKLKALGELRWNLENMEKES